MKFEDFAHSIQHNIRNIFLFFNEKGYEELFYSFNLAECYDIATEHSIGLQCTFCPNGKTISVKRLSESPETNIFTDNSSFLSQGELANLLYSLLPVETQKKLFDSFYEEKFATNLYVKEFDYFLEKSSSETHYQLVENMMKFTSFTPKPTEEQEKSFLFTLEWLPNEFFSADYQFGSYSISKITEYETLLDSYRSFFEFLESDLRSKYPGISFLRFCGHHLNTYNGFLLKDYKNFSDFLGDSYKNSEAYKVYSLFN